MLTADTLSGVIRLRTDKTSTISWSTQIYAAHEDYSPLQTQLGYCLRCGTPRNPQTLHNCPACGETDWDAFTVTPTVVPEDQRFELPPPWEGTKAEWGRMIGIRGPKGIGKSTLMAQLCRVGFEHPDHPEWGGGAWWITCEESANQVRARNKRIGLGTITVHHISPDKPFVGMNAFYRKVVNQTPKVVILDSASGLGQHEGQKVCESLKMWGQINQVLVGVIVQLNKGGDAFGFEALGHLVDAWGYIGMGRGWLRTLGLEKNRFGELFNRHWRFSKGGGIVIPEFSGRILTVVGEPGNYELLPYPYTDRGKLHQVWSYLEQLEAGAVSPWAGVGVLPDFLGKASAGVWAPFKEDRFEIPDDWPDRKRYAELHGSEWLDPRELPPTWKLVARAKELRLERERSEREQMEAAGFDPLTREPDDA